MPDSDREPCTNYITLKGLGGVEVPLYSVILWDGRFAHAYVIYHCVTLSSHHVVDFAGQPSSISTF